MSRFEVIRAAFFVPCLKRIVLAEFVYLAYNRDIMEAHGGERVVSVHRRNT